MKAISVQGEKKNPTLVWEDAAGIGYGPDEVLVEVRATAVNRADLSQARGHYPPPPGASDILGLEMAGVVHAVGASVTDWRPGDRVCALLPGGGYAEQVAVPAGMLLRLPDAWSFAQGAAVPEVWYTAFINLFDEGQLRAGETALIHAGASGVGTAAIQLAVEAGARAIATVGSVDKAAFCGELGALAINYKEQDFLAEVMAATDGQGVDVILDPVGGDYLARNVAALGRFGRLVNIGLLGGTKGELNMGLLLGKRLRLVGSTLRARPVAEKIAITRRFEAEVWPKLIDGQLRPIIDRTFPIAEAQAAHEYVLANRNIGKVILEVS
ncbi:NAD(P)H quinone oxidoreductase, PIG3 family [Candidatus Promineifilum breve]|uniref:NAD(P)H quinone oxidoreductase, PIG3 family n=1 Tax=Candidatus Promineifilum breve TaxID=1806508 RepID=A0A160T0P4_9CHLR|nr:NAD(P)H-quinone oxidoreductase [Candidatus Promineifilum breve]CUS02992.2 NAD(P)H quinone oxidoreductase, PIG3 family [Candidatus Promineifilum breve]